MSSSESGSDPIHSTRLWRAVRRGDVTELTNALPLVRGVDGHGQHVYQASSPDRGRAAGSPNVRESCKAGARVEVQGASRLPTWRPVSLVETDGDGQTVLHLAAELGNVAVVSLLLERGAELNAKDATGRTPLVHAAKHCASAVVAALVAAAYRTERATDGKSEDLEHMLDRSAREAVLTMLHNAADAGDVAGVRSGLEAVATIVGKAICIGDTMYIEKILAAGLEVDLSAAATLARRRSQISMAKFLEDLDATRAPRQPTTSPDVDEGAGKGHDPEQDPSGDEQDDDDLSPQPEQENQPLSIAERLATGEVRLLEGALLETDLVKIDKILATHRESFRGRPAEAPRILGAAASDRTAVREAWYRLKRRRRELERAQRQNRDFSIAKIGEDVELRLPQLGHQRATRFCGLCREVLTPPASQCAKGHVFCGDCLRLTLERVPRCPIW